MTTKRSANRLTRSSGLGASVWAPTVGFATLGMATVAAITMVGLEQGVDHVHGTPAADAAGTKPPAVTSAAPKSAATHKVHEQDLASKSVSFNTHTVVPDATAQVKARSAEVVVTTRRAAKVVTKAIGKTNPAPAPAPKGAPAPAPSHAGSGSTSGGSTGTPSQGSGSGSGLNTPVLDVKVDVGSGDLLGTGLHL